MTARQPRAEVEAGSVRLLDADPDLAEQLPTAEAAAAREALRARVAPLEPGLWDGRLPEGGDCLGALLVAGLVARSVTAGRKTATELLGPGDVVPLRDELHQGELVVVPSAVEWRVLEPAAVALIDAALVRRAADWPKVLTALLGRSGRRAHSLALQRALAQLTRVEDRLLVLLWHLAERWGRVSPEGVRLELRLTHELIGRLLGAERPSVSSGLKQLAERGMVIRQPGGVLVLPAASAERIPQPRPPRPPQRVRTAAVSSR